MPTRRGQSVLATVILCLVAIVSLALPGAVLADHTTNDGDYTVQPRESPRDRSPNATRSTYDNLVEVNNSTMVTTFTLKYDDGNISACGQAELSPIGIDYGADDPNQTIDESLADRIATVDTGPDRLRIEFATGNGSAIQLSATDELVVSLADCIDNPPEPGWYQLIVWLDTGQRDVRYRLTDSLAICTCSDEQDARERLGPPAGPTPTATPHPTVTDAPTPTPTPTASPTPSATPSRTATSTPTDMFPSPTADSATPTRSPTPQSDDTPTRTMTAAETPTVTPDQPGFGILPVVLALLVGLLVVATRTRLH